MPRQQQQTQQQLQHPQHDRPKGGNGNASGRVSTSSAMTSVQMVPLSAGPPRPFAAGEIATIGQHRFLLGKVIGEGAYARVWEARLCDDQSEDEGQEVAIKEMRCGVGPGILPDASFERARFEVEVMFKLAIPGAGPDGRVREDAAAPRVLDHQFWPLGPSAPEGYLCRVAMERRRGTSLVSWLQGKTSAGSPTVHIIDEVDTYCRSFLGAASAARALLVQLCPTFERLNSEIAIHRDVNARNLLVHCYSDSVAGEPLSDITAPDAAQLEFSLVDFGSSTDAKAWLAGGEGSWQQENPTGDARYWGPASWMRFLGGAQAIAKDPNWLRQYSRRLDLFALAVCALEILAKLHTARCPSEASLRSLPQSRGAEVHLVHGVQRLRASWSGYWKMAVGSFERLAEYSRLVCCGDKHGAAQRWQELSKGNLPGILAGRLRELCDDLVSMGDLCRRQIGASAETWVQAADALDALREMAHEGSSLEWAELARRLGPAPALPARRNQGHMALMAARAAPPPPLPQQQMQTPQQQQQQQQQQQRREKHKLDGQQMSAP